MRRTPLRKQRYIFTAIVTAIIFILGFAIGLVFENKRVDYVNKLYEDNALKLTSSQVQYDYLKRLVDNDKCEEVFRIYQGSLEDLDETTRRLESYANNEKVNKEEFDRLKRRYILSQMEFYMLGTDIHNSCPNLDLATILYFYGTKEDCPDCETQAFVLDYIKRLFGQNVLIFSFNAEETNDKAINLLAESFSIKELPTIVVVDKVFEGLTGKDILQPLVCEALEDQVSDKCR